MSFLSDIHSYISGNTAITNVIPATQFYTGLAPESLSFPYVVIVAVSHVPTPTTGAGYYATFGFQIDIYDTDPDNVESLANLIGGQFDYQQVSASTISCERQNGPVLMVDPDTAQRTYHAVLEYLLLENKTLPAVG